MSKLGTIYRLTNLSNSKSYIGLTKTSIKNRLKNHTLSVRRGSNTLIHNSLRKYGINNFSVDIIEIGVPLAELSDKEVFYINKFKTYYKYGGLNLTKGGEYGNTITNHPNIEEIKRKMSESHMGEKNYMYGRKHSEESRKKMSENRPDFTKCKHPQAKTLKFTSPEGEEYVVCGEVRGFCKQMGLSYRTMSKYINKGVINLKHARSTRHNGWRVENLPKT